MAEVLAHSWETNLTNGGVNSKESISIMEKQIKEAETPSYTYEQLSTLCIQLQGIIVQKDNLISDLHSENAILKDKLKLIKDLLV